METELNIENFESEVLNSDIPVLVDFWADWCGPCMMLSPIIEEISETNDNVKVCKVNVDEQPVLTAQFSVESIPTLLIFKNGELTDTLIGYRSKEDIEKHL
ncbi:MAG: thioredoxin [Clostridia bacterium]|nr:thioredoxin [Clostridia bacterium]